MCSKKVYIAATENGQTFSYSEVVITLDFESSILRSNRSKRTSSFCPFCLFFTRKLVFKTISNFINYFNKRHKSKLHHRYILLNTITVRKLEAQNWNTICTTTEVYVCIVLQTKLKSS